MSIRYRELFRVDLRHDYYDDGVCVGLKLVPTQTTQHLMRRHGFVFRPAAGGGSVWHDEADGQAGRGFGDPSRPFAFALEQRDADFMNFTELRPGETEPAWTIYYFSNLDEAGLNGVALPVRPRAFRHVFVQPGPSQAPEVVTLPDEREVWRASALPAPFGHCDIDLGDAAEGRHLLRVGDRSILDFYLTERPAAELFGIVDVFPGRPGASPPVQQSPDRPRTTVTLRFENRRTIWRYVIIAPSSGDDYGGAKVTGGSPPVPFSGASRTTVAGRPAWAIESLKPIPLYENPSRRHEFRLSASEEGTQPRKTIRLPYADALRIRFERHEGETRVLSDIFVNP